MRIVITGAAGQLGQELVQAGLRQGCEIVALNRSQLDITDCREVGLLLSGVGAQAVINAAAYTAVDQAEEEKLSCYAVNAKGPEILARVCAQLNLALVHVSSDYVFGQGAGPHGEEEIPDPLCWYARTKYAGELKVQAAGGRYVIVRTACVFGACGDNFVKRMLQRSRRDNALALVNDNFMQPTPARALAEALVQIAIQAANPGFTRSGIYHYTGDQAMSAYVLGNTVIQHACRLGLLDDMPAFRSMTRQEYGSSYEVSARRPEDSRLDCRHTLEVFSLTAPSFENYLPETLLPKQTGTPFPAASGPAAGGQVHASAN